MVIPTVPPEPLFWQDLARCDYFPTSLEIGDADIYKVVGEVCSFSLLDIFQIDRPNLQV